MIITYPLLVAVAMVLAFECDLGLAGIWLADSIGMGIQMIIFLLYIGLSDWSKIIMKV